MTPQDIRKSILRMAFAGNYGHIGPSFSLVEILLALEAFKREGDEIILSKGHGVQAQYAIRYAKGELGDADLDGFLRDGSALRGVSPYGALGHGLSVGVGAALGRRRVPWRPEVYMSGNEPPSQPYYQRTFVIVGDGELNEGACWEAIAAATQWRLGKLYMLVDLNGYQALGSTETILDHSTLADRLRAFGWCVETCHDGNNVEAVIKRLGDVGHQRGHHEKPKALICRTTKGHGVSFMAHNNDWHYNKLTPDLYEAALKELDKVPAGDM